MTLFRRPTAVARPVIDGRLDEEVWQRATPLGALRQVVPVAGAAPSEATDVLLFYDDEMLYVGLRCWDRDPAGIRATQMQRDANLDPDDRVEILVDPFLDRRNAFWFQIGAAGSRGDALVTANGANFNKQWDGIWYGRARTDSRGWFAEMALPVATLRFDPATRAWGFNLRRHIRRRNEEVRWAAATPRLRFFTVANAGTLHGVEGLRQGLGVDVRPFGVVEYRRDRVDDRQFTRGDFGGDVLYRLTPNVKLSLSINTDFAETEVDEQRVNLTRFPLFFPEKRDFFLEDSGIFAFGTSPRPPAATRGRDPVLQPTNRDGRGLEPVTWRRCR